MAAQSAEKHLYVFEIQTFTAQPDYAEDRIRLDAVDQAGETQSILLTRRLCDRFLPVLVQHAEQEARPGVPKEIGLAMSQQQLRIERAESPLPDVQPAADAPRWLCLTMHLTAHADALEWAMTDDAERSARIFLEGDGPRAVLDVLLMIYRQLEWSLGAFPSWLTDEGAGAGGEPVTLN